MTAHRSACSALCRELPPTCVPWQASEVDLRMRGLCVCVCVCVSVSVSEGVSECECVCVFSALQIFAFLPQREPTESRVPHPASGSHMRRVLNSTAHMALRQHLEVWCV